MSEKKEYIERSAALRFARETVENLLVRKYSLANLSNARKDIIENIFDSFTRFPAADVEPVVRGEWIEVPSSDLAIGRAYKCSICEKMRYGSYLPPYCQCCGAHMERSGSVE